MSNKKKKNSKKKVMSEQKKAAIRETKILSKEAIVEKQDKLTSWFMINIIYIIVGYAILKTIEKGYNSTDTILYMENICWGIFGGFLVAAVALFALYYTKFKRSLRMRNYGILMSVCSLGGLYLALYNKIRLVVMSIIPAFEGINSNFRIWSLMILLGLYAVASLVWYCVKLYQTSKSN